MFKFFIHVNGTEYKILWYCLLYHTYYVSLRQNFFIEVKIQPIIKLSFSTIFVITITLTNQSKISTLEGHKVNYPPLPQHGF